MRDYAELIEALRTCKLSIPCTECPFYSNGDEPSKECATMNVAAADAIEELLNRDVVPMDFHERCLELEVHKRIEIEKQMPHWISVEERLPEMYQPVLTFDGKLHTVEMRVPYILDGDGEQIESDWWVEADNDIDAEYYRGLRDGAATHWMPLPQPPKEDSK